MLGRGRPSTKRSIGVARELTVEDVVNLERAQLPAFQKFRDSYHAVARLVALGLRIDEIASRSGYRISRVRQLTEDPTFQAVVEAYRQSDDVRVRAALDERFLTIAEAGILAERMRLDQLREAQENGDFVPYKDLNAIASDSADRTGYGKVTTKKITMDLADRLAQALAASAKVINARPTLVPEEAGSNVDGGYVPAPACHPLKVIDG